MCSVKRRPNPGLASRRSRSGAGTRRRTRLAWNGIEEVREPTLRQTLPCATPTPGAKRPGLATRPRERKEGVLGLELVHDGDGDGHSNRLDAGHRLHRTLDRGLL